MSTTNRLGELLVREKLISLQQLRQAQEEQRKNGSNLGYALAKLPAGVPQQQVRRPKAKGRKR
jgi:hypothetical protein